MPPQRARPSAVLPRIRRGDAYDLIRRLPSSSVDLLLTSPPYWGLRSYGQLTGPDVLADWLASGCSADRVPPYDWYRDAGGVLGLEPYPQWYVGHLVEFFNMAKGVLKDGGN